MEHDIFISYAHHDDETHEQWVRQFAKRLEGDYRSRTERIPNTFSDNKDLHRSTAGWAAAAGAAAGQSICMASKHQHG